jgi:hypothetical protein
MMFKREERVKQMSWSEGICMMYELDMTLCLGSIVIKEIKGRNCGE